MNKPITCILLAGVLGSLAEAAPIRDEPPRILLTPEKISELRKRTNSEAWRNWSTQVCATFAEKQTRVNDVASLASEYGLLYQLNLRPCGGSRQDYAARAQFYAIRAIIGLALKPVTVTEVSQSELTSAEPHRLAPGKQLVIIAGGTGALKELNSAYLAAPDATDPRRFRIECTRDSIAPCTDQFQGTAAGQKITMFQAGRTIHGMNQARWYYPHLAEAYDWAHEAMTDPEKTILQNLLTYLATYRSSRIRADCGPNSIGSNLCMGGMRAGLFAAIATADEWTDGKGGLNAQSAFREFRSAWQELAPAALANEGHGSGGAFYEGPEYSPQTVEIHIDVLNAIRSATGDDLRATIREWPRRVIEYTLHSTSPQPASRGGYAPIPYADVLPQNQDRFVLNTRAYMSMLAEWLQETGPREYASYAAFWNANFAPEIPPKARPQWLSDFLYAPAVPPVDYRKTLPPVYHDLGLNIISARSDWSPGATWVQFFAGKQVGGAHLHADAGNFSMFRKGKWLVREVQGWGGRFTPTWLHNTLVLHHLGSKLNYVQGRPVVSRYEASEGYVYAGSDLSPVYKPSKTGGSDYYDVVERHFLYLRPDHVVVADRIRYRTGLSTISTFVMNFDEPPTTGENDISSTTGDHRLYASVVYPLNPVMIKRDQSRVHVVHAISGKTTAIFLDDSGVPAKITLSGATGQWAVLNGTWPMKKSSDKRLDTNVGTIPVDTSGITADFREQRVIGPARTSGKVLAEGNRVEIQSAEPRPAENFLIVMQAAGARDPKVPVRRLASKGAQAAQFGSNIVAMAEEGNFEYSAEPGSNTHYILGLLPSASYRVTQEVDSIQIRAAESGRDVRRASAAGILVIRPD